MTILYLVCSSEEEAGKIAEILLNKRLVACAKKLPVKSVFRWKGELNRAAEVVLLLETEDKFFDAIESEVRKLHSHKTFILASIPVGKTSEGVTEWLKEELAN